MYIVVYNILTNRIRKVLEDRSDPFIYTIHSGEVANSKRSNIHWSDELLDSPNVSVTRYLLPW